MRVQAAGVDRWADLFNLKGGPVAGKPNTLWNNADLPTIDPWMVVSPLGRRDPSELTRNPYFYAVDPDGNQLPYIDNVFYDVGSTFKRWY